MSTPNAIQFNGNFDAIEQFVGGYAEFRTNDPAFPGLHCVVASRQGPLRVRHGDWILRNRDGSLEVLSAAPASPSVPRTVEHLKKLKREAEKD